MSANADTNFYDINEDSAGKKKEWHVEIGSDVDLLVTDQFSVDAVGKRVTLAAETGAVYALRFPSSAALSLFEQEYNSYLFENTYGLKNDAKNRDQASLLNLLLQLADCEGCNEQYAYQQCSPMLTLNMLCCSSSVFMSCNFLAVFRYLAKTMCWPWAERQQSQGSNGLKIWM